MKKFELTLRKVEIGKTYDDFIIVGVNKKGNLEVIDTDCDNEKCSYKISNMVKTVDNFIIFRVAGSSTTAQSIGEKVIIEFECESGEVEAKEKEIFSDL